MLLRTRILVPVTAPPIEDGAVLISQGRIQWAGPWRDRPSVESRVMDLGDAILSPGWVNAHCHLEYSLLHDFCPLPEAGSSPDFVDWIRAIIAAKARQTGPFFAEGWRVGARQLVESGTTTVADILSTPTAWQACHENPDLNVHPYWEMTGVLRSSEPGALVAEALARISNGGGFSPHALYSTTPALLTAVTAAARPRGVPLTIHLAESHAEGEMYRSASGRLYGWLSGVRSMEDCGSVSPVEAARRTGVLYPGVLAAHVNDATPGDATLLAAAGVCVVHCPRSHAYFNHPRFPFETLRQAGVPIALGTDSRASLCSTGAPEPVLAMQEEIRQFRRSQPGLDPQALVRLATVSGAQALGFGGQFGEIRAGQRADLLATPHGGSLQDALEAMICHQGSVLGTLVRGRWVWRAPGLRDL